MSFKTLIGAALMSLGSLIAAQSQALDLSNMTDAERAHLRAEIREYLVGNPEVLVEAMTELERREAMQAVEQDARLISAHQQDIFEDGYSWIGGNPDGDITLVEFMDYRCGYCRRAFTDLEALLERDGNVRLIIKEFPILGEDSVRASQFAIAVRREAGNVAYENIHKTLITRKGPLSEEALRKIAQDAGLDAGRIMAIMDEGAIKDELRKNRALAQILNISGTPTFVLENELLRGYVPLVQMEQIIAQKRDENG